MTGRRRACRRRSRAGRGRGRSATVRSSASQPGAPSRSKQASWSLTATQAGPAATMAARQWSATASAVRARARRPPSAGAADRSTASGQSAAGSGSSPSTTRLRRSSTSAASRSQKCVANPRARTRDSRTSSSRALDGLLQRGAGAEARHLARRDLDLLAGLRVHTLAGAAVGDRELPEAGEVDLAAARQHLLDRVEDGVDRLVRPHPCPGPSGRPPGPRTRTSSRSPPCRGQLESART